MRFHVVVTIIPDIVFWVLLLSCFERNVNFVTKGEELLTTDTSKILEEENSCFSDSLDSASCQEEELYDEPFESNNDFSFSEEESNYEEDQQILSHHVENEDESEYSSSENDGGEFYDDFSEDSRNEEESGNHLELPDFVQDNDDRCAGWMEEGYCLEDPHYMLRECLRSCLETEQVLQRVFFSGDSFDDDCHDLVDENDCSIWAEDGNCYNDEQYMMVNCPKTCYKCIADGMSPFEMGESQIVDDFSILDETINIMLETVDYMTKVVMQEEKYAAVRRRCLNKSNLCSHWAAKGLCTTPNDIDWMQVNCAPACGTCEMVDMRIRCPIPDGVEPALKESGDLNRIFERIIGEADKVNDHTDNLDRINPEFDVNVLSRPYHPPKEQYKSSNMENIEDEQNYVIGPWVITIDDFLTASECDRLIVLGYEERYERSTEVTALADGTVLTDDKTETRTSTNAWCKTTCYEDPVAQQIIQKISNLIGIPENNSEYLQLLKYEPGQFYRSHHDYLTNDKFHPSGPRILTIFLYLNDVKEGGGTRFNDLGGDGEGTGDIPPLDVQPKRGMALLWPSVLDEDPLKKDFRTFHEALMVTKGLKYGANAWFHLRDNKSTDCS